MIAVLSQFRKVACLGFCLLFCFGGEKILLLYFSFRVINFYFCVDDVIRWISRKFISKDEMKGVQKKINPKRKQVGEASIGVRCWSMVVLWWVGIAFVRFGASVAIRSFVGRVGPLSGPKFINCRVSDFRYGRHTVFVDPNLRAYVRCAIQSGEKTPILIDASKMLSLSTQRK